MGLFSFFSLYRPFFMVMRMEGRNGAFKTGAKKLYCFADSVELCEQLLDGGAEIIQLRAKELDDSAFYDLAREMQRLIVSRSPRAVFIINDRAEIALSLGADGLHLGQDDSDYRTIVKEAPPRMIVGVSVKTVSQALDAQAHGAAYVGAGAVFSTATKKDTRVIGLEGLRQIVDAVDIPVVAIGGISQDNIGEVVRHGASYFAVISAINQSPDISRAIASFNRIIELT